MRPIAFLLLLLCGCSSLSFAQQEQLAGHQRNAKYYLEGGRLDQALDQIDRGLALAPGDYQLRAMRGTVLLRQSGSSMSTDHRLLDAATTQLAEVFEERSPSRHEPFVLLPYALALQKQGRRHLGEAVRLRGQSSRAPDPTDMAAAADAEQEQARSLLTQARGVLDVLIERGELMRQAWSHELQIAQDLGDDPALVAAGAAYLEQAEKDQSTVRREIDRTQVPAYEAEQTRLLQSMRAEELEVRGLLADHHFARRQYEPALAQLDRMLEIDPQRLVDYYNRARVLMELQRVAEAKADFKKFVENSTLPPSNDKIALAMRVLYP